LVSEGLHAAPAAALTRTAPLRLGGGCTMGVA